MAKRGEEWAERDAAVNWCIATVVIALVSTFILAVLCFALSYLVGKGISQDSLAVTWKFIKRIAVDPAYLAGRYWAWIKQFYGYNGPSVFPCGCRRFRFSRFSSS